MLPYSLHKLLNVKHQNELHLWLERAFKNSGVCASEQRLYQQVPVTASWEKQTLLLLKTNLPEFQKDTYHAYIHSIHKRFLPQTHSFLESHLIVNVSSLHRSLSKLFLTGHSSRALKAWAQHWSLPESMSEQQRWPSCPFSYTGYKLLGFLLIRIH